MAALPMVIRPTEMLPLAMQYCSECDQLRFTAGQVAAGLANASGHDDAALAERAVSVAKAVHARLAAVHEADGHHEPEPRFPDFTTGPPSAPATLDPKSTPQGIGQANFQGNAAAPPVHETETTAGDPAAHQEARHKGKKA